MDRQAPDLDLKPQHAGVGAHQHLFFRLGDQHCVGLVTAQMGHQGAVAGGFFFHHGLDIKRGSRLQAETLQRVQGKDVGCCARLHVGRPATIHPVAHDDRVEGSVHPHVGRTCGNHVQMRLEDQGTTFLLAWTMDADDDGSVGMFLRPRRAAGMLADGFAVHGEAIHRVIARMEFPEQEILDRMFRAARGRKPHQFLRESDLLLETFRYRRKNIVAQLGIKFGHGCNNRLHLEVLESKQRRSNQIGHGR